MNRDVLFLVMLLGERVKVKHDPQQIPYFSADAPSYYDLRPKARLTVLSNTEEHVQQLS